MAGETPSSTTGATITPRPVDVPVQSYQGQITPAIEALSRAFEKGLVSQQQMEDVLTIRPRQKARANILADEDIQASKLRQALAPAQAELEKAKIDSEFQIVPRKALAELGAVNTQIETQNANQPNIVPAGKLAGKQIALQDKMTDAAMAGGGLGIGWYQPGKPGALSPFGEAVIKRATESNQLDRLYNPDGSLKPPHEAAKALSAPGLTGLQSLEETQALETSKGLLKRMEDASNILFGPKTTNPVGPVIGQPLNPIPIVEAITGSPDRRNAQRELTMLINDLTAEKTRALKGSLSEKELKFLQETAPKLSDDEAVWKKFLNDRIPLLKKAMEVSSKAIGNRGEPPAAGATSEKPDASGLSNRTLVNSQAEYDALAPGTPYRTADGTLATKGGK